MSYSKGMKMGFMFARPGRTNDKWAPPEDSMNEMPHIKASVSIDGERLEAIDLRIERYPIPGPEKAAYFNAFKKGLVGRTGGGDWVKFTEDSISSASESDIASLTHLPEYWEDYALKLTESFCPSLRSFLRG